MYMRFPLVKGIPARGGRGGTPTGARPPAGVAVASERSAGDEETGGTPVRSRH